MGGLWTILARTHRRRPLRAALTAAAVGLGVTAFIGVQTALGALDTQADEVSAQRAGRSDLDVRSVAGAGIGVDQVRVLSGLPGVAEVDAFYEKRVAAKAARDEVGAVTVTVIGVSERGEVAMRPVVTVSGHLPGTVGPGHEVALDQGVVDDLAALAGHGIALGDTVFLTTSTGPDSFTLVGVTSGTTAGAAFTRSAAFVTLTDAAGPFALGLHTPLVALRLDPAFSAPAVAGEVRDGLGGGVVTVDPHSGAGRPLDQLRPLLALVVVLSVVIGAGVSANSVAISAAERRRELGLLRAAGASRRQVLLLLLAEAEATAAAGTVLGIAGGLLLATVLVHQSTPADLGAASPSPGPLLLLAAVATGLGAALLGALLPALAAQRLRTLEALRFVPHSGRERTPRRLAAAAVPLTVGAAAALVSGRTEWAAVGVALLLGAIALVLPFAAPAVARGLAVACRPLGVRADVAAANLARRRNRTGLVVSALATSVGTAIALSVLTAGALDAGDRWTGQLFAGDSVLVSPVTARDAVADTIAAQDGVAVGRLRFLSAPVDGAITGITAMDVAPYQDRGGLDLVEGDRQRALERLTREPSVLVPQALADRHGWHIDHVISVDVGNGSVPVAVAGVVAHGFPSGDGQEGLLMDRTMAVRTLGAQAAGFDDLQVLDGAASRGRVAASATAFGMKVLSVDEIRSAVRSSLDHSLRVLEAVAWIAVIVAMLAVVNTLVVNVRQGTRDLALLRAVGLSRRDARRLVLAEAGLLSATGVLIGVVLGCLVALPMLHASATSGFSPGFTLPLAAMASAAGAVLAGSLLAAALPARRAAATSIVGAIRHE